MRESWPSIWLGDLFSSVSYQRPVSCRTVCHNRQSASSIKHPRPSLSLSFSTIPSSLSLSYFVFLYEEIYPSLSAARGPHARRNIISSNQRTHVCTRIHNRGEPMEVYARANPRIPWLVGGSEWSTSRRLHLVRENL